MLVRLVPNYDCGLYKAGQSLPYKVTGTFTASLPGVTSLAWPLSTRRTAPAAVRKLYNMCLVPESPPTLLMLTSIDSRTEVLKSHD
ncbi:hypothetical protein J6590_027852 [Homalodisca vitripennis]|nr:hypothetical protein J6590_027852 [Homalodisca vitripennis]